MATPGNWKMAYRTAVEEMAPARKLQLCDECRHLIQARMTELGSELSKQDRDTMEEALRSLWVMEQEVRNPKIH